MTKAHASKGIPITPTALPELPVRVDRRTGAALVTRLFFPVSPRTLEVWPLTIQRVNGKATVETAELFAVARAKLAEAPVVRAGRRAATQHAA